MRKGLYSIYRGKEFRSGAMDNNKIKLISNDEKDLKLGFSPSKKHKDVFTKVILVKEADDVYRIHPKAKYKGEIFGASQKPNNRVLLACVDAELAAKLGFDRTDKYMYSKYVDLDEVDIIEEKKPYPAEPK